MKAPKYILETIQQAIDLGLNGFALKLMAESFADAPAKFGDENVVFLAHAHNGQEVWFIMSKKGPCAKDFDVDSTVPPSPAAGLVDTSTEPKTGMSPKEAA